MNRKRVSLMLVLILITQILVPAINIILENNLTLISVAADGENIYINTAQDLWDFAAEVNSGNAFSGKTIYLTKDINLGCNENNQWIPIGTYIATVASGFDGTFDGQNHSISGIYINTEEEYQGLFGFNTGTIKNVNVIESEIEANSKVGGIVGYNYGYESYMGEISNCTYSGTITSGSIENGVAHGSSCVGGIAGYNYYGIIEYCEHDEYICINAGGDAIGGITGLNSHGIINNCINKGILLAQNGGPMGRYCW